MYDLRNELEQQVGEDMLPRDYVFLKSVGRSITRVSVVPWGKSNVSVYFSLNP